MFSKNIRTLYLYSVCFITLMMFIGGIIATVGAVSDYFLPTQYSDAISNIREILNSIAVWVIVAPIFIFHWIRTQKEGVDAE